MVLQSGERPVSQRPIAKIGPGGMEVTYFDQGVRENPASRGTETSAEVLVGPPGRMVSNAGQRQQWYERGGHPPAPDGGPVGHSARRQHSGPSSIRLLSRRRKASGERVGEAILVRPD